jgi:hypothetical protein
VGSQADKELTLRLKGDDSGLEATLTTSSGSVQRFSTQVQQANAQIKRSSTDSTRALSEQGQALGKLVSSIDPVIGKFGKLDEQFSLLQKFKASGAISGEDFTAYALKIEKTREELAAATAGTHGFNLATSNARVELGRMIKDISTGQYGRLAQSTTTLASQTGLLGSAFSLLVSPIGLVVGAVAAAAVGYVLLTTRNDALSKSLAATGNYAASSAAELRALGAEAQQSDGHIRGTADAVIALGNSGRFTGETLKLAGEGAAAFADLTGEKIEKAISIFEKLGKDPLKVLADLDDQYHFLSADQIEQIAQLEQMGDKAGATALAVKVLSDAMVNRDAEVKATLSSWSRLMDAIGASADRAKERVAQLVENIANGKYNAEHSFGTLGLGAQIAVNPLGTIGSILSGGNNQFDTVKSGSSTAAEHATEAATKAQADFNNELAHTAVKVNEEVAALDRQSAAMGKSHEDIALDAQQRLLDKTSTQEQADAVQRLYAPLIAAAQAEDAAAAAKKHHHDASQELARDMDRLRNLIDQNNGALDPLAANQAKYNATVREADEILADVARKHGDVAQAQQLHDQAVQAAAAHLRQENLQVELQRDVLSNVNAAVQQEIQVIGKSTVAKKAEQIVQAALNEAKKAGADISQINKEALTAEAEATLKKADADNEALKKYDELMHRLESGRNESPFEKLVEDLKKVNEELVYAKAHMDQFGQARIDKLQEQVSKLQTSMVSGLIGSTVEALKGIQKLTKEGSKEYEEMRIAIDALAIAQAVLAVIHQGTSGDPYSAFARMAAMVAAVAPLLADIGASIAGLKGSSTAGTAQEVQATQGTGTVLGDATKQSESISKAVQITADATSKLVGISTGMLDALRSLQQAIGGAANLLARGAGKAAFDPNALTAEHPGLPTLPFTGMDKLNSFFFGGSKKVIDQGVDILGGALVDLLNGTVVSAYETIKKSGGLFGSDKIKSVDAALSDPFNKQMQLVLGSIVDTVREAAKALGVPLADIQAKINEFHVAETKISLKGLSADDQQKALEAVFSSIFDGLAGAVVPFVEQFQQVGEGLGETLVRVATEVQVTQQAMKQLGLSIETTDPQKFAQIADGLIKMAGGVDAFIEGMNAFTADFAPDAFKFSTAQDALKSGLEQVGLTLPGTREGFWELMQSLDASTDAGQKQIATLLRLADTANAYYGMLEKQQANATQAAAQAAAQFDATFKTLVQNTQQLAAQLFGTGADQIKAKIDELMQFGAESGIYDFRQITALKKQLADQAAQQQAAQQLAGASSLLGNFGQLGALTGNSLDELAKEFNVPLDKLADLLHTDQAGLAQQFALAEQQAQAALSTAANTKYTNELLANILAQQQGLPLPYSVAQLGDALTGTSAITPAAGGKPAPIGAGPPTRIGAQPASVATASSADASSVAALTSTITKLAAKVDTLGDAVSTQAQQTGNLTRMFDRYGMGAFAGWNNAGAIGLRPRVQTR